jgi:hypothetical protein
MIKNSDIIIKLSKNISSINSDQDASKLVKEIDKHVQQAYSEFYKYREQKSVYKSLNDNKRGHCC